MGKVMGWLAPRTRGRADGKHVSELVARRSRRPTSRHTTAAAAEPVRAGPDADPTRRRQGGLLAQRCDAPGDRGCDPDRRPGRHPRRRHPSPAAAQGRRRRPGARATSWRRARSTSRARSRRPTRRRRPPGRRAAIRLHDRERDRDRRRAAGRLRASRHADRHDLLGQPAGRQPGRPCSRPRSRTCRARRGRRWSGSTPPAGPSSARRRPASSMRPSAPSCATPRSPTLGPGCPAGWPAGSTRPSGCWPPS